MTQLRGVSNLLTLSVRKRIFGGFAVVLLLLTVLAAVALRGMDAVSAGAGRVSQDSSQATASAEVALQVADARALVVQYALTATMDDQKAAQASLIRLDQAIEQNRGSGAGSGSDLQALATRYRAAVNATIATVEARRTTIEQMQTSATELRTIVSATAQMLDNDTAPPMLVAAARLADSFGTTDSASARFVASRAPSDASAAGTTLQGLRAAVDALAAASTDNRRAQRFVKGLKEPLDRFGESLQRLVADDDKLRAATVARPTDCNRAARRGSGMGANFERLTIEVDPSDVDAICTRSAQWFGDNDPLRQPEWSVRSAVMRVVFYPEPGSKRGKMVPIELRRDGSRGLREQTSRHQLISQKYLVRWGLIAVPGQ